VENLLANVNASVAPGDKTINLAEKLLRENKKNLKGADDNSKCSYFMLRAWTSYFLGDLPDALKAASKAYKTNRHNADARVTQAALAIIADEKPLALPPERKSKTASSPAPAMGSDILSLNIDDIKTDMLAETLGAVQVGCLNSTIFAQFPGQTNLCLLLWQLDSSNGPKSTKSGSNRRNQPAEPNIPGTKRPAARQPQQPAMMMPGPGGMQGPGGMPGMMMPGMMPPVQPRGRRKAAKKVDSGTFEDQINAFTKLAKTAVQQPASGLQFAAINLDPPDSRDAVIEKIFENPWPWANIMANDPSANAGQFTKFSVDTKKPILIITRKDNTIKYAGPATGFLTTMVLDNLSGTSVSAPAVNIAELQKQTKPPLEVQKKPDRQEAAQDGCRQDKDDELTSDSFQAQKLLSSANDFIKMGRFTTYKKGIDMCRQVINSYPDTKYADQGRQLLRKVPERYRQKYNITNEEMGL